MKPLKIERMLWDSTATLRNLSVREEGSDATREKLWAAIVLWKEWAETIDAAIQSKAWGPFETIVLETIRGDLQNQRAGLQALYLKAFAEITSEHLAQRLAAIALVVPRFNPWLESPPIILARLHAGVHDLVRSLKDTPEIWSELGDDALTAWGARFMTLTGLHAKNLGTLLEWLYAQAPSGRPAFDPLSALDASRKLG